MYSIELPVKPLEKLYVLDTRTKEDGGYTPHVFEFTVYHYHVLADGVIAVNEYGHRIPLELIGIKAFVNKEDAEKKLKEVLAN
jgi:hypothetical protein